MSDHYNRSATFPKGNLARGDQVQSEFDLVETGFTALEAEVDQAFRFTNADLTTPVVFSENSTNRANTVPAFNASGVPVLSPVASLAGPATAVDITGGTIDGTVIGGTTPAAGTFTTLNATGGGALTGTWSDLGTVTTVDINGGTVDGAVIGGAAAAAGSFTTLSSSGLATLESLNTSGASDNGVDTITAHELFAENNLGVGTTAPSSELEVHAGSNPGIRVRASSSVTPHIIFERGTGADYKIVNDAGELKIEQGTDGVTFGSDVYKTTTTFHNWYISNAVAMKLTGGDLHIGGTNPDTRLHVTEGAPVVATFESTATQSAANSGSVDILRSATGSASFAHLSGALNFKMASTADTDRTMASMYVQTTGNYMTDGLEDGRLVIRTTNGGSNAIRGYIGEGIYTVAATGGDQGANTVNASELYEDGVRATTSAGTTGGSGATVTNGYVEVNINGSTLKLMTTA